MYTSRAFFRMVTGNGILVARQHVVQIDLRSDAYGKDYQQEKGNILLY